MGTYLQPDTDVDSDVITVADKFGWLVYNVEDHPSRTTIVTFDARPALGYNEQHGALFEMNMQVVRRMARRLRGGAALRDATNDLFGLFNET